MRDRLAWWRTARVLDALGHADVNTTPDGAAYIAPATLVRLPVGGLPRAVVVGARTVATVATLEGVAGHTGCLLAIEQQDPDLHFAPCRIAVEAEDEDQLNLFATEVGLAFSRTPSAWDLVCLSSDLQCAEEAAHTIATSGELNWNRRSFDPVLMRFSRNEGADQCRLVKYVHSRTKDTRFWLWRGEQHVTIDPDWGRYAVLESREQNVLLRDERSLCLAVPIGAPLPKLLARAAVLCSGFAPSFIRGDDNLGYDVYRWVPHAVADMIATKLGQEPTKCRIALGLRGQ